MAKGISGQTGTQRLEYLQWKVDTGIKKYNDPTHLFFGLDKEIVQLGIEFFDCPLYFFE